VNDRGTALAAEDAGPLATLDGRSFDGAVEAIRRAAR
jgi:hypothetical protein